MVTLVYSFIYVHNIFETPRKISEPNRPFICMSQIRIKYVFLSEIWNVSLSVISEFCPSSVVTCSGCRLEIFTKTVLTWLNFWFLRLFVWAGWKHCPMFEKHHKNERHLCLETHIFTKHSQNVCLINVHMYW